MADKEKILVEDDNISSESIDTAHIIGVDLAGTHERFRKQNTDIYDIIEEALQNALDSKDIQKSHGIRIYRGRHPTNDPNQWVLKIVDQGGGIAQEYQDDPNLFIEAKKASSEKTKKQFKTGFKGIGMFQFTEIGEKVVFRSMYNGLITKFSMILKATEDPKKPLTAFTRPVIVAATRENMIKYDIYENGTDIRFYDRPDHLPWIQSKKLIEKIRDDYAMRIVDNPQLAIVVFNDHTDKRGTRVPPVERMVSNPPVTLGWITDEKGQEHLVRGCIWKEEKSTGKLEAFRGHKIEDVWWDNRQATGYFECWALDVDSAKHTLVVDKIYNEVRKLILGILQEFPRAKDEKTTNPKVAQKILEMAKIALAPLLPKIPTSKGGRENTTKNETIGDPDGTDKTGYRISPEPDPNRIVKPRPGGRGIKHDMHNQSHVSSTGDIPVKIQDENKDKRQNNPDLIFREATYNTPTPLFLFFKGQSGKGSIFKPAELILCKNNAEYSWYNRLIEKPQGWSGAVQMYLQNFVEILQEDRDPSYAAIRLEQSAERVKMAQALGIYYGAINMIPPKPQPEQVKGDRR